MRPMLCAFAACLITCTSLVRVSFAAAPPPLADRVPDDAIIYFGWEGADAFAAAPEYQQSNLKALLDNSNMRQVAQDLIPKVLAKVAQKGGVEAAMAVDTFKLIGGTVWQYPTAAYFTIDMGGGGNPMPHAAIFSRAGKDAPMIQKRLDELLEKLEPPAEARAMTFVVDDIVGISIGFDDGAMALAGGDKAKALGNHDNFKAALAKVGGYSSSVLYVDAERALGLVDGAIQLHGPPDVQEKWPAIREATGIASLRRIVVSSGFDGKGWSDRIFVDCPGPRKGIFSIVETSPVPDDLLKMIPATATNALVGGMDFAKAIDEIRKILGEVDPQVQEQFGQVLGAAQMYTAVNLESDLFAALGEHWAVYEDPTIAGSGFLGMVVVNKPRDAAKAQRSLTAVGNAIANTVTGFTRKEGVEIAVRTINSGDITVTYLAVPFISPAWTMKDGYLYFALYPQNALSAAKRGAPSKSILDNPAYASVREKLKVQKPTSIQFSDLPKVAEDHYQGLLLITRAGLGFADLFGIRAPELVIPPMDVLVKHLEPAGAMSWSDESGFYWKSTSPFPHAELINGPSIAALAAPAAIAGAMQPLMQKNEQHALRDQCASRMRDLGQAFMMYRQAHENQYPPDLGTLAAMHEVSPELFVCPKTHRDVPERWVQMTPSQKAAWVNRNTSYIYLGAGLTGDTATPQTIVLHDRENRHDGAGMNLLFGDGHTEFKPVEEAKELISTQKGR